jgi:hypothetical protein
MPFCVRRRIARAARSGMNEPRRARRGAAEGIEAGYGAASEQEDLQHGRVMALTARARASTPYLYLGGIVLKRSGGEVRNVVAVGGVAVNNGIALFSVTCRLPAGLLPRAIALVHEKHRIQR